MPAINFQKQFVEAIVSGQKKQTIRSMRKRPFKKGDRLYLYTGMRTKNCHRIGLVVCSRVETFEILPLSDHSAKVIVEGVRLSGGQIHQLAVADGFQESHQMMDFFSKDNYIIRFKGQIIHWDR